MSWVMDKRDHYPYEADPLSHSRCVTQETTFPLTLVMKFILLFVFSERISFLLSELCLLSVW